MKKILGVLCVGGALAAVAEPQTMSWDFSGEDAEAQLAEFKKVAKPTGVGWDLNTLVIKKGEEGGVMGLSVQKAADAAEDAAATYGFKVVPPAGCCVKSFELEVENPSAGGLFPLAIFADQNYDYSVVDTNRSDRNDYGVLYASRCTPESFFHCSIGACYASPVCKIAPAASHGGYANNAYAVNVDSPIKPCWNPDVPDSRMNLTKAKFTAKRVAQTAEKDGFVFDAVVSVTTTFDPLPEDNAETTDCPFTVLTGALATDDAAKDKTKLVKVDCKKFIPAAGFGFQDYKYVVHQNGQEVSRLASGKDALIKKFTVTFETEAEAAASALAPAAAPAAEAPAEAPAAAEAPAEAAPAEAPAAEAPAAE